MEKRKQALVSDEFSPAKKSIVSEFHVLTDDNGMDPPKDFEIRFPTGNAALISDESSPAKRSTAAGKLVLISDESSSAKRSTVAELRILKDIQNLDLPEEFGIRFPSGKDDLTKFEVLICSYLGYYSDGKFIFSFEVPSTYPYEGPKVKCKTETFHPNIDLKGNVQLDILGQGWKPVMTIATVIHKLYHLLMKPNYEDYVNEEAAMMLRDDPSTFEVCVNCVLETIPETDFVGFDPFEYRIESEEYDSPPYDSS